MSKKKPIHLSLFPNENCEVCGIKVPWYHLHCEKCFNEWIKRKSDSRSSTEV